MNADKLRMFVSGDDYDGTNDNSDDKDALILFPVFNKHTEHLGKLYEMCLVFKAILINVLERN